MNPIRFESEAEYRLSPDQLWTFIADTQRLNRSIGLPNASFTFEPRAEGGSLVTGIYKKGFFTISRWLEHPFEFVKPRYYKILREYDVGPFTRVQGGAELKPSSGGTVIRVWADITPRHWLGALAARILVGPQSTSRVLARCRTYEKELLARAAEERASGLPLLQANMAVYSGTPPEVDHRRLDQLTNQLIRLGGDEMISALLKQLLAEAPDDRVASMRAFELADLWEIDRRETLATFLRATTAGMLDLRWDVLCPNCRVPKDEVGTLAELSGQVHCESCHITVDANFDRLVEVRFKPAAAIRDATYGVYCTGGPQSMPHVVAQVELFPDRPVDWDVDLKAGTYVLASPQSGGAALLSIEDGEGESETTFNVDSTRVTPPAVQGRPSVALRLESTLSTPAVVQLADQSWADTAATAALVSTMHEFRDLFSSEVLAPGLQVAIERLALLFTDLSGSTAMYERVGQARAFRLVQDHFRVLDRQ
jgi:adenylate cyclase